MDAGKPEIQTDPATLEDLDSAVARANRAKGAAEQSRKVLEAAKEWHQENLRAEREALANRAAVLRRLGASYRVTELARRAGMKQQLVSTILNDPETT